VSIQDYPDWSNPSQTVGALSAGPTSAVPFTVTGANSHIADTFSYTLFSIDLYVLSTDAGGTFSLLCDGGGIVLLEVYLKPGDSMTIDLQQMKIDFDVSGTTTATKVSGVLRVA
jgi:hypothetical protein